MRTLQAFTILAAIALTAAGVLLPVDMAVKTRLSLALSPTPDRRVVTVEVDDRALAVFGRWPWPRSLLAQLVARVAEADPAVIGVDIILSEPDPNGTGDLLLAETMGDHGRVVLPMHVESYSLPPEARLYASSGVPVCPVPVLADRAAGIGHVIVISDSDAVVRRVPMVIGTPQGLFRAFSSEVVRVGLGISDVEAGIVSRGNLDSTSSLAPAFPFPSAARRISAADLLGDDRQEGSVDRELRGKFVLIGVTARGIGDRHQTPVSAMAGAMPGLLIHAAAVNAMLSGVAIRSVSPGIAFAAIVFMGLLLSLVDGAMRRRERHIMAFVAVHACAAGAAAAISAALYLNQAIWIGPSPFVLLSMGLLGAELYASSSHGRQLKAALSRYAGVDSPEQALEEISAGTQKMAVMFADLRGWSAASEGMDPVRAAELVNEYLSAFADAVVECGGNIEGFPGDAVFAVFEGHGCEDIVRAVLAATRARDIAEKVVQGQDGGQVGLDSLRGVGVGIAYGDVARAELGGRRRAELTVVGSTVNTAKALEDAAAEGQILVGIPADLAEEEILAAAGSDETSRKIRYRLWQGTVPKVQPGSVRVFEIL
jgi:adenylate cyclase